MMGNLTKYLFKKFPKICLSYLLVWLVSIVIFIGLIALLYFFPRNGASIAPPTNYIIITLFIIDVGIGTIAFLALCAEWLHTIFVSKGISFVFFQFFKLFVLVGIIIGSFFVGRYSLQNELKQKTDELAKAVGEIDKLNQRISVLNASPSLQPRTSATDNIVQQNKPPQAISSTPISETELFNAINTYRRTNNVGELSLDDGLTRYARKRVSDHIERQKMLSPQDNILDQHEGFKKDIETDEIGKYANYSSYGENIAYGLCKRPSDGVAVTVTTAVQLVEWCFDSSEGHKKNLLNPKWTKVGIAGGNLFYVQIFAK